MCPTCCRILYIYIYIYKAVTVTTPIYAKITERSRSGPSEVIDTTKSTFDLSLRKSTANRLDYLYEISHVPEDSKIPITDFPIVNPYTVFDKPQVSFKKFIKKLLGPS